MNRTADFEDRMAARLLGVDVDADATVIRGQFRRLVLAVHPDRAVGDGCVDLGRLAEAKDRLIERATSREVAEAHPVPCLDAAAAASRLVESLRLQETPAAPSQDQPVDFAAWTPSSTARNPFVSFETLGQRIDIAG